MMALAALSSSDDVAAKLASVPVSLPSCTPRRCTVESDFAMSADGVDLTNFLKGLGRSRGRGKGWGSW